jgi:hypothetical protein
MAVVCNAGFVNTAKLMTGVGGTAWSYMALGIGGNN